MISFKNVGFPIRRYRGFLIGFFLGELIISLLWLTDQDASIGDFFGTQQRSVAGVPSQILTSLYPVRISKIPSVPDPGSGGAIDAHNGIVVVVTREGEFYRLGRKGEEDLLEKLPLPNPIDKRLQQNSGNPFRIGVRDLKLAPSSQSGTLYLYASVSAYEATNGGCVRMRLIRLQAKFADFQAEDTIAIGQWETVFRANRCVPSSSETPHHEAGGAIAFLPDGRVLLTIGPFGFDGADDPTGAVEPQLASSHLGKVIAIEPETETWEVYSFGHRNADGIVVTESGDVWAIEHGPRGGDELNRIEKGANYGWPLESYGTDYGRFELATDETPGDHRQFSRPLYSWVPSLGVSGVGAVKGSEYPLWDGDLLVSSLKGARLDRVRIRGGRVVLAEPLEIGLRVRDIAIDSTGVIYIKPDTQPVILKLENAARDGMSKPNQLAFCASCHQINKDEPQNPSGPSLVGVVGRRVAGDPNYAYSDALESLDGVWTADRLAQFIANPDSVAPGTTMPQLNLKSWEIGQAVNVLAKISAE